MTCVCRKSGVEKDTDGIRKQMCNNNSCYKHIVKWIPSQGNSIECKNIKLLQSPFTIQFCLLYVLWIVTSNLNSWSVASSLCRGKVQTPEQPTTRVRVTPLRRLKPASTVSNSCLLLMLYQLSYLMMIATNFSFILQQQMKKNYVSLQFFL